MSRKAEPALRAAADALYASGWDAVSVVTLTDAATGEAKSACRASFFSSRPQRLDVTRAGEIFTIDRFDGGLRVGKQIVAENAAALARALAEEPPPARRK